MEKGTAGSRPSMCRGLDMVSGGLETEQDSEVARAPLNGGDLRLEERSGAGGEEWGRPGAQ